MKMSVKDIQQKGINSMQGAEIGTEKLRIQKEALQIILVSDDGFVHCWHIVLISLTWKSLRQITCTDLFFFFLIKSLTNQSLLNIYIQIRYNT